jgi:hypothetical protein
MNKTIKQPLCSFLLLNTASFFLALQVESHSKMPKLATMQMDLSFKPSFWRR